MYGRTDVLQSLLECLWLYGPRTEGVFRRCASVKTYRQWRDALDAGQTNLNVDSSSVHIAAGLLKVIFLLHDAIFIQTFENCRRGLLQGHDSQGQGQGQELDPLRQRQL